MVPTMAFPERGPWPHPYYETPAEQLVVEFSDAEGHERRLRTYHKVTGSGSPLVLVHGLMTSSYSWRYVISDLAGHYRLFVPDLVGAGSTEKPTDFVYSVGNIARFLTAYIRTLGVETPYLVGNSLGGLYCLKALLDSPRLVHHFILMHAPGYPMARMRRAHLFLGIPLMRSAATCAFRHFGDAIVARSIHYHRADLMSEEEVNEYGRLFKDPAGARVFVRMLRETLDPSEHASIVADLKRTDRGSFACRVLVLYARSDVLVPPEFGSRFAEDIPGASLRWVEQSSHFIQVDQPARTVAEILAFDGIP